jgi:hypothetical protein
VWEQIIIWTKVAGAMIMVMVVVVALVVAVPFVMIVWHEETWVDDVLVDKRSSPTLAT